MNQLKILIYLNERTYFQQRNTFETLLNYLSSDGKVKITILAQTAELFEKMKPALEGRPYIESISEEAWSNRAGEKHFDVLLLLDAASDSVAIEGASFQQEIPFLPEQDLDKMPSEALAKIAACSYVIVDSLIMKKKLENQMKGEILYLPNIKVAPQAGVFINRRNFVDISGEKLAQEKRASLEKLLEESLEGNTFFDWRFSGEQSQYYCPEAEEDIGVILPGYSSAASKAAFLDYGSKGKPVILPKNEYFQSILGVDYPLFIKDINEIKGKLAQLFDDQKLYASAAEKCTSAAQEFDYELNKQALLDAVWSAYDNKTAKKTILFVSHDFKFLQSFIDICRQSNLNVLIDKWDGHKTHDEEKSLQLLEKADIVFCEWGLGNAQFYSHHLLEGQDLYIRVHRQELETSYLQEVNYEKVTNVITISPLMMEEFQRLMGIPREKIKLIPNMIDTNKFKLPKKKNAKFNLGIIGILPKLKRLDLAIAIFEKLWEEDNRYQLHIKGKLPAEISWMKSRVKEMAYYDQLFTKIENAPWKENVIFSPFGSDIAEWLTNIGFILSTSDLEAFHLAPMEGIASGAAPIVFKWNGAELIYPSSVIVTNIDEAVEQIKRISNKPELCKTYQELPKNYDIRNITTMLMELIMGQ